MSKKRKQRIDGAKVILTIYYGTIFFLVLNILYLGLTGRHFLSGQNIRSYASKRNTGQVSEISYAKRGTIFTSDEEVVAQDAKKYKMYAILSKTRVGADGSVHYVKDKEKTAKEICKIIDMPKDKMLDKLNKDAYQVEFGYYGNNLTKVVKDKIEALQLPGIEFSEILSRNYRYGSFASYEIGYTAIEGTESTEYLIGQMGIEKTYNNYLKGTNGLRVYMADSKGYMLPNGLLSEDQAIDGNDLYLTINSEVQSEMEYQMTEILDQMDMDMLTCAFMDVKTGKILGIYNYPTFDPNKKDIENYLDNFYGTAIEPGSVYKAFTYGQAIEEGLNVKKKYNSGVYNFKNNKGKVVATIHDHNEGKGWGKISYEEGFYHSSNTAICHIIQEEVDKKNLRNKLSELGFFTTDKVDGIETASGICGYKNALSDLELLTTGFGQGSTMTAYQLMKGYSCFANEGKEVTPYLVDRIVNPSTNEVVYQTEPKYSKQMYSKSTCKKILDLLYGVVNIKGSTGTAFALENEDQAMIGKTGTGQVVINGKYSEDYYTHSFVGMAPYDDPQVEVVLWYRCKVDHRKIVATGIKKIMEVALEQYTKKETEVVASSSYVISSYLNQSTDFVNNLLSNNSLSTVILGDGDIVVDQYPKANIKLSSGSKVFLKTNNGEIKMPSMIGWSRKEAESFANMANVTVMIEGVGTISSQSIKEGTVLEEGQELTLKAD